MFVFSLTSDQRPYFLLINKFWPKMVFITDFRPEIFTTDFGSETLIYPNSVQKAVNYMLNSIKLECPRQWKWTYSIHLPNSNTEV